MSSKIQATVDSGIIIKEGFMVKRGHVRHNWKTRWFKLSDTSLRYYKSKKDKVPHGRIALRNAKLSIYQSDNKSDSNREFVMQIQTSDGIEYPIQAPSNSEMRAWMESIGDVIEHMQLESESKYLSSSYGHENNSRELSTSEILGSYVDAYGGIKRETRTIKGVKRSDGFSGLGLRVWMEHTMGLLDSEAEITVSGLQRVGLLELLDGDTGTDPFAESKYYILLSDEDSLKVMAGANKSASETSESDRKSQAEDVFLPPEIPSDALSPTAILPADMPPGEIVKRGVLFKKGHVVPNWKARCFVLQRFPATLSYFDPSKKNPKVLNSLSLHGASVFTVGKMAAQAALRMRHPPDHLFCVKIAVGTLYIIMASSDDERDEWIRAIKPMCRKINSRGNTMSSSTSSQSG
ncbi:pleckstrin-2-like isoform X2 [Styela clava]|uniref:pleckstrin-2-like isoform X2 n=1 Tax=Styela clava TaxID=7725 RepID=UPI00193A9A3F|nr:pleckstrin-2-like isoform X2 [Styela clava]